MKIKDTFKLVKHEFNYGKPECISAVLMHTIITVCILLTMTVATEFSRAFDDYMTMIYPEGYTFYLKGFEREDYDWLENRGFTDIFISSEGSDGMATIGSIERIWRYKFQALFSGRDLWNEETDLMLEVVFFGRIVFVAIALILFIVMFNSSSNSFLIKLDERGGYIRLLRRLGAAKSDCIRIFALFFMIRWLVALILSVFLNAVIISRINKYIVSVMHIRTEFSVFKPTVIAIIAGLNVLTACFFFRKIWSKKNEW